MDLINSNLLDFYKTDSYESVSNLVEKWKNNYSILPEKDIPNYINFISVLKFSSQFWDPKGENGIRLLNWVNDDSKPIVYGYNWWKVAAHDANGAIWGGVFGGPAGAVGGGAAESCASILDQAF